VNVQKYLAEDLNFIENLMSELRDNITKWPSTKILDKTDVLFATFHKRFTTEDFLLRHLSTTANSQDTLREFLNLRSKVRENLDNILVLRIDDPAYRTAIARLGQAVFKYTNYLKTNSELSFDQISA